MLIEFFPTGFGLIAFIIAIMSDILYRYFRKNDKSTKKWITFAVGMLSFIYFFVGCCVLFQDRYIYDGELCLNSGITEQDVVQYLEKNETAADLIEALAPNYTIDEQIEQPNSDRGTYYYNKGTTTTQSSEISIEFCNTGILSNTYLRFKQTWFSDALSTYRYANDSLEELVVKSSEMFSLIETPEAGEYVVAVFVVKYDGIRFIAPWVDNNGSSIQMIFYYDDTYIKVSETADSVKDLTLISKLKS